MIFKKDKPLRCSFCGKQQDDVKKLIAGPSVYICDECVEICREIIEDDASVEGQSDETRELQAATREPEAAPDEAAGASVEWVACPACSTPLVLRLTVKPDRSFSRQEIEFPTANPPKT